MASYAEAIVVNHAVLVCVVVVNHGEFCCASGCESCCDMLSQWL